ncbi:MAG: hypothetical protein ACE5MH_00500 [Terriglobia bacterium]
MNATKNPHPAGSAPRQAVGKWFSAPVSPVGKWYGMSKRAVVGGAVAGLLALVFNSPEVRDWSLRLVFQWGPGLVLGGALLYMVHIHAPRFVSAQTETALALQHLAQAVQQLVERDSAFQREQDVLLNHVARRVEALFPALEQLERQLNGVANPRPRKAGRRSSPAGRNRRR